MHEVEDIQDAHATGTVAGNGPRSHPIWSRSGRGRPKFNHYRNAAGQIVMEGYLNLRIAPWLRRLITRLIAIIPAFIVISIYGESQTGAMLIFSQVVLSLQLGFAIVPLIHFNSDKEKMGVFVIKPWVKIAAWLIAELLYHSTLSL
jgi:manganese transport protein